MTEILIEPDDLALLLKAQPNTIIIDTRAQDDYNAGHIPNAVNLHEIFTYLSTSDAAGLAAMRDTFAELFGKAGVTNDSQVVFYEQSMSKGFGQSCRGHFLLSWLGLDNSRVLHGGFEAWCAGGHPTCQKTPVVTPQTFTPSPKGASLIATKEDVLTALETEQACLVDVRDVDEWIGATSSPYGVDFCPRKGRIPGAKWLEWYRMMKPSPDGPRLKSPNEVRAECMNIGLDTEKPIILYCFKGARTSSTYVALKQAGVKNVATYFGSWNEWSRDPSLPIEEGMPTN